MIQKDPRREKTTHGILALLHVFRWACDIVPEKSTNESGHAVMHCALVVMTYNEMARAIISADRTKETFWVDDC